MAANNELSIPYPREFLTTFFDRTLAWLLGYPPETNTTTTQPLRIPIFSGLSQIVFAADLIQPLFPNTTTKPKGTILLRSPYGRGFPIALQARVYAARGYQVLVVSTRGTFGSGGDFDPFRTEVEDGLEVVKWMRKQAWYTGSFATIGGSYLGFVQWALLCDPPEDMVAAVPVVSPHDFAKATWGTGALDLDIVKWADNVVHQEEGFSVWRMLMAGRRVGKVLESVPLGEAVRKYVGGQGWFDKLVGRGDIEDEHYTPMNLDRALERAKIPVLIITGWYDLFLNQSMEQYKRLEERGCIVALTVGPWSHISNGIATKATRQGFDWIEEHLGGQAHAKREAAVQYFVTGAQEWRNADVYPPATTPSVFYLSQTGLSIKREESVSGSSSFTFDPRDPTPTIGGTGLLTGGSVNDTALSLRSDVLTFDTPPLNQALEFCGQPIVQLAHQTDSPFADIFVRISEVDEKGRSRNITEVFKRLDPKRDMSVEVNLELNHAAHRFGRGKRIRLVVAGGNFPQYARNYGVEDGDSCGNETRTVEHVVQFGGKGMSRVVLPVVVQ